MKFAWSGFRSLLAFAIMAVTSADPANSLAAGAAPCAAGCWASAAEENIVRIVKNTCARMTASCGRRLYSSPRPEEGHVRDSRFVFFAGFAVFAGFALTVVGSIAA